MIALDMTREIAENCYKKGNKYSDLCVLLVSSDKDLN